MAKYKNFIKHEGHSHGTRGASSKKEKRMRRERILNDSPARHCGECPYWVDDIGVCGSTDPCSVRDGKVVFRGHRQRC